MNECKLCYVENNFAYFTTNALDKQWGDDWNDAPYEHNAGSPYPYREYMKEHGIEPYEIKMIAWHGDFQTPDSMLTNSCYSVEDINIGKVAWLSNDSVSIFAGVNIEQFTELILSGGGKVFLEPAPAESETTK